MSGLSVRFICTVFIFSFPKVDSCKSRTHVEIASKKLKRNLTQGQGLSECEIITRKLFSITLRFTPATDSYARMNLE